MATLDRTATSSSIAPARTTSPRPRSPKFVANGFHRARPLRGGLDAWNDHCAAGQAEAEFKPKHG
jgi:hypothetical protein